MLRESSTCSQLRNRSREKRCRARGKSRAKTKRHRAWEKLQYRGAGSEDTDGEQKRENLGQVDHPSGASEPRDQMEGHTVPCVSQPCGIPPSLPRGSPHRKGQHIFQRHLVSLQNGSPNVPQLVIVPVTVSLQLGRTTTWESQPDVRLVSPLKHNLRGQKSLSRHTYYLLRSIMKSGFL